MDANAPRCAAQQYADLADDPAPPRVADAVYRVILREVVNAPQPTTIIDPPIASFLFADTRMAWVWLPVRIWLGWGWLTSGWGKSQNPAWVDTGAALKAYWERALVVDPKQIVVYDWYREFLQLMVNVEAYTWFAKVITFSEIAIGIALILGAFTGLAAFGGGFLNWNFIMAGSASSNGLLLTVAVVLVLAWKNAGWIGLDRWLLQGLGTPWRPGRMFKRMEPEPKPDTTPELQRVV